VPPGPDPGLLDTFIRAVDLVATKLVSLIFKQWNLLVGRIGTSWNLRLGIGTYFLGPYTHAVLQPGSSHRRKAFTLSSLKGAPLGPFS
jgi:hypothetical protein